MRVHNIESAREFLTTQGLNTILFDLDGTLINSEKGIVESLQFAVNAVQNKTPSADDIKKQIGLPLRAVISSIMGVDDSLQIEQVVKLYRERFEEQGMYDAEPFSGVFELLEQLKFNDFKLYVVTAKLEQAAKQVIKQFGFDSYFADVFGPNYDGYLSIKTDLLREVLKKEKIDAKKAVMIGDTKADITAGVGNGVFAVGVTYGFGTEESLIQHGANVICNSCDEIKSLFVYNQ